MKEVEEIKKIRKLSYVIIVSILSFSIFIGSHSSSSLVGGPVYKYLVDIFTEHYITLCLKQKYLEPLIDIKGPRILSQCIGKEKSIKINNIIIFPNTMNNLIEKEELEKYNSDAKNRYEYNYSNNTRQVYDEAIKTTEVLMWVIFLLSLPIIWLSRDLSIYGIIFINKVGKLISKGWKKI